MAHFAEIDSNGKVLRVVVIDNNDVASSGGDYSTGAEEKVRTIVPFTTGVRWVQTSYNTRGGVHYGQDGKPDGGVALRGNYAGIGYTYDQTNDVFYAPKPFASWVLNNTTWTWEAPTPQPNDGKFYMWDEPTTSWVEITPDPSALAKV